MCRRSRVPAEPTASDALKGDGSFMQQVPEALSKRKDSGLRRALQRARLFAGAWSARARGGFAGLESTIRRALPKSVAVGGAGEAAGTLYAFYDLEVLPPTYDIASFLAMAEVERRRMGLDRIHVVLVPGRQSEDATVAEDGMLPGSRSTRIVGILLPILRLFSRCSGQTLCGSRAEAAALCFGVATHVFPKNYNPRVPSSPDFALVRNAEATRGLLPLFAAPSYEKALLKRALEARIGDRKSVVISLREYGFMPRRNAQLDQWLAFADSLDPTRYAAVFVRDTERALELPPSELSRHAVLEAPSWNLGLRMALYELAYLNMGAMHGAFELCWFNADCRYVAFLTVGTSPQTSAEFLQLRGFVPGQSLPFARPWQKLVWEPDALANIERAFADMVATIERGG